MSRPSGYLVIVMELLIAWFGRASSNVGPRHFRFAIYCTRQMEHSRRSRSSILPTPYLLLLTRTVNTNFTSPSHINTRIFTKSTALFWCTRCHVKLGIPRYGYPGYPYLRKNRCPHTSISANIGTPVPIFTGNMGTPSEIWVSPVMREE